MDFLHLTQQRYSCRNYLSKPVEQDKLDYIKECVRMAPSAVNRQPWRFRLVHDADEKQLLRQCYDRAWFTSAPLYIIAFLRHDEQWVRNDGKAHGDIDVAIAVEHLCLAAAEQGLATCWVCNFDVEMCRKAFAGSDDEEPVVLIPIGYAANAPSEKMRKPAEEIWG
ncbi:MAG: nitroreductase family protein [Bacteroidaceae bacterium]|nr:nitroreductase family protein [Bacteroidaceae bacterium]